MSLFVDALQRKNTQRPPLWLMRQAGRYHSHYQDLRKEHSFEELCKRPQLATKATLGPIQGFDFDAAILFSDILFPLEAMGMGLRYDPHPQLRWRLRETADLKKFTKPKALELEFQALAIQKIRTKLSQEKGLIGFVGAPLTLFYYAVCGSHRGDLEPARERVENGLYHSFCQLLLPLLTQNMAAQAKAGADVIAIFDTCAGDLPLEMLTYYGIPPLRDLLAGFRQLCPQFPVLYYSKGTTVAYYEALRSLSIQAYGIDWNINLSEFLEKFHQTHAVQGNIDPRWLLEDKHLCKQRLEKFFTTIKSLPPSYREGWICGLGHGVLPKTPEENVKLLVELQRKSFN